MRRMCHRCLILGKNKLSVYFLTSDVEQLVWESVDDPAGWLEMKFGHRSTQQRLKVADRVQQPVRGFVELSGRCYECATVHKSVLTVILFWLLPYWHLILIYASIVTPFRGAGAELSTEANVKRLFLVSLTLITFRCWRAEQFRVSLSVGVTFSVSVMTFVEHLWH